MQYPTLSKIFYLLIIFFMHNNNIYSMKRSLDNSSYKENDKQKPLPKKFKSLAQYQSVTQYPCELCPRTFSTQNNLSNHIKTHTKKTFGNLFICPHCSRELANKRTLSQHIQNKHTTKKATAKEAVVAPITLQKELSPRDVFIITQRITQVTQRDLNINNNNALDDKLFIEWLKTL